MHIILQLKLFQVSDANDYSINLTVRTIVCAYGRAGGSSPYSDNLSNSYRMINLDLLRAQRFFWRFDNRAM